MNFQRRRRVAGLRHLVRLEVRLLGRLQKFAVNRPFGSEFKRVENSHRSNRNETWAEDVRPETAADGAQRAVEPTIDESNGCRRPFDFQHVEGAI